MQSLKLVLNLIKNDSVNRGIRQSRAGVYSNRTERSGRGAVMDGLDSDEKHT